MTPWLCHFVISMGTLCCYGNTYMMSLVPGHGKQCMPCSTYIPVTLQTERLSLETSDFLCPCPEMAEGYIEFVLSVCICFCLFLCVFQIYMSGPYFCPAWWDLKISRHKWLSWQDNVLWTRTVLLSQRSRSHSHLNFLHRLLWNLFVSDPQLCHEWWDL